jgi:hypothetical protein
LKHSRILACRWLLVLPLVLLSCHYSKAQPSPGKPQNCVVKIDQNSCQVTVIDCKTSAPGEPLVDVNDTVTWEAPIPFWIDFKPIASFSHTPVSASRVPSGRKEPVRRDWLCNSLANCYYKYSLTRQSESTPCIDPGVRVVPPPSANLLLYLELVALVGLVGLVSFAVWRIMARKPA